MILSLFLAFGFSWWGHAHVMIARIARSYLTSHEAKVIENAINYGSMPYYTLYKSATWQDDLKDVAGTRALSNWHFMDTPIIKTTSPKLKIQAVTYNVSDYIKEGWMTVTDKSTTSPWSFAFHLRSLIHFVGDIHTPHHNCMLYDDELLTGDAGGNFYYLNCEYGSACNNIHFLWDSVGLNFALYNPLLPNLVDDFEKNYTKIIKQYPKEYFIKKGFDLKAVDPIKWNLESFSVGKEFGYSTPKNKRPSDEYIKIVQEHATERVVLAGYRLGEMLKYLVKNYNIPSDLSNSYKVSEIIFWILDVAFIILICVFIVLNRRYGNPYLDIK